MFSPGIGGGAATAGDEPVVIDPIPPKTPCEPKSCAELGYECGSVLQCDDQIIDCADEGLTCGALEICVSGGVDQPARCETSFGACEVCGAIPECEEGSPTRITGRVVTPGRNDTDTGNQVGIPNAVVYILRSTNLEDLPPIATGIPEDGTSCDRCEDQDLGPFLLGTVTDATGRFTLEGSIPVNQEFLLVVKVGRFRRAIKHTVTQACANNELPTTLPGNPTRLARSMDDGLAVNIPAIAVTTGEIDAMECVLEKMGIGHSLFGNPAALDPGTPRVHLFRGKNGGGFGGPGGGSGVSGARIDADTPDDTTLYGTLSTLLRYDFVIADCKGSGYDGNGAQRMASGANLREYVNRGGRMFASHLSYTWIAENGNAEFDMGNPIATGLAPAATWGSIDTSTTSGTGLVSVGRPAASPRIDSFTAWLSAEGVATAPDYTFNITEPRSQALSLGQSSEEFVYTSVERERPGRGDGGAGNEPEVVERIQQFSFNTPYGAPEEQVCGRVAYSGFHVAASGGGAGNRTPFADVIFPAHCTGSLTAQEKVLLYMIFDLGACIGDLPPPPECVPETCESTETECGYIADGCGKVVDCGPCIIPPPN